MKKKVVIILILIIVSVLALHYSTYARYIANSIWDYYLNSNDFYFESDKLSVDGKHNINNSWNKSFIALDLKNYANDSKHTKSDIEYEVTCSIENSNNKCLLNGEEVLRGTISGENATTDIVYFEVTGDIDNANVIVTAKALSPYKKTLTGTFELNSSIPGDYIDYDVINYENYGVLNISNYYKVNRCVHISFSSDEVKILENNNMENIKTDENGYINAFDLDINGNDVTGIGFSSKDTVNKNVFNIITCD